MLLRLNAIRSDGEVGWLCQLDNLFHWNSSVSEVLKKVIPTYPPTMMGNNRFLKGKLDEFSVHNFCLNFLILWETAAANTQVEWLCTCSSQAGTRMDGVRRMEDGTGHHRGKQPVEPRETRGRLSSKAKGAGGVPQHAW